MPNPITTLESVLERLDASGDCWEWTGALTSEGYGAVMVDYRHWSVHRFVWTHLIGAIPPGMQIDHRCRKRICANPDHLEVVSLDENRRRSAFRSARWLRGYCRNGHSARVRRANGTWGCRICARDKARAYRARHKQAALAA